MIEIKANTKSRKEKEDGGNNEKKRLSEKDLANPNNRNKFQDWAAASKKVGEVERGKGRGEADI
jgi:hypothetical protein